jgi:hypothetical protein
MAFAVPESKRSLHQNQFEFTVPGDDTVYRIPKAKYLTVAEVEKLSDKDNIAFTDIVNIFGRDDETGAAVRQLDTDQLEALMNAYNDSSGIQLGESSASK